jgi:hypothetical protein
MSLCHTDVQYKFHSVPILDILKPMLPLYYMYLKSNPDVNQLSVPRDHPELCIMRLVKHCMAQALSMGQRLAGSTPLPCLRDTASKRSWFFNASGNYWLSVLRIQFSRNDCEEYPRFRLALFVHSSLQVGGSRKVIQGGSSSQNMHQHKPQYA